MTQELFQLVDSEGRRLYLTNDERQKFIAAAERFPHEVRTYCHTLAYTGCRPSEGLELFPERFDFDERAVTIRSLKKRTRKVKGKIIKPKNPFRRVIVPTEYMNTMNLVHDIRRARADAKRSKTRLWAWSRTTAWRHITEVMEAAGIEDGPHRTPKGLRHSFGVNAIMRKVPLSTLQKWMGHAHMETTAIYANAVGEEERDLADRMWA